MSDFYLLSRNLIIPLPSDFLKYLVMEFVYVLLGLEILVIIGIAVFFIREIFKTLHRRKDY